MTSADRHGNQPNPGYGGFRYGRERGEASGPALDPHDDEYYVEQSYVEHDYDEHEYDDDSADVHYDEFDDYDRYDDDRYDDNSVDRPHGAAAEGDDEGQLASLVTRRRFLAGLALGSATGYTAFWALTRGGDLTAPPVSAPPVPQVITTQPVAAPTAVAPEGPTLLLPAPLEQRILVLIELEGGNDGPSTVVPFANGTYYDLRPNMAVPAEEVLKIDEEIGLNPNLARLHARQMAVVEGVGPLESDLSHFDMVARWEHGDLHGNSSLRSGFLARLADGLDRGGAATGLSVTGFTPRFNNVTAPTLSLDNLEQLQVLTQDDWIYPQYRKALTSFSGGPMTETMSASWKRLVAIGKAFPNQMTDIDYESTMVKEGGDLGRGLAMAAEVLKADLGVKVVHARMGGFDTHDGHQWRHKDLMMKLDVAIDGFLQKLADYGLSERVLVATTSEFGRRAKENGNGFDHGAASTLLLFGPVKPGRYGQAASLTNLDKNDNLKSTVPFDIYLGTLAQVWLGLDAASVLPTKPEVLPII